MNQITVTGMILRSEPIGEFDRRVVILTKERGKISAFARGAKNPKNQLSGRTTPITFGEFILNEGRTSYTLVSASISNYFSELKNDMVDVYYGYYFSEIADYYAREATDERELLLLLYQTMRALTNPNIPNELIRLIYELKVVTINGEGPQVMQCMVCGDREREKYFSMEKGGVICNECIRNTYDGRKLLPSTLYTMQYIVASPVKSLYSFVVTEEVLIELKDIISQYFQRHVDRHFKSLEMLEIVTK